MGVIEGFFNAWFLRQHKEKTIKDVYLDKESVKYRNIVMCPPHLVEKWAESIREDIPYAVPIIVRSLKVLIQLRKQGKKRTGKEFYILSKDTGKLSYTYIPIPTQVKTRPVRQMICKDCKSIRRDYSVKECVCKSKHWEIEDVGFSKTGMVCPDCGELLFPADIKELKFMEDGGTDPLQPYDFAVQTAANRNCRFCGAALWQPSCEPLESKYFFRRKPKRKSQKWIKLTHWANKARKNKRTVWVYKNKVEEYISDNELVPSEISYPRVHGPRKFALSRYISKYLRGYFDFAIFDEAHEYKGGGSAQGLAMHDIIKATDRQLALTGTIAGGYASHFFYLLYRLDPAIMKAKGYEYSTAGERKFVEKYGTIETEYEVSDNDGAYNAMTRGHMIGSPHCRPGISPLIYVDFLIDRAVFLNLSDMSHFLPPLHESVEYIDLEPEISSAYYHVRDILKSKIRQGAGRTLLGSFLQFSLSYTDKPYNRQPIRSPIDGAIITHIEDLSHLVAGDKMLFKEQRLCELVNEELAENRNMFIYCEYTGDGESNVTHRLKQVITDHCNVQPHEVCILESSYPAAEQREQWMHEKASEGVRVFITNPRCVKTGLDFLFRHKNVTYNYPTIINYQEGYDMFTCWQACRRHYRLNQTEECRTYFLVSSGTIQPDAVEMVASKQVATSAIQGQFSSEGLCAMARGVDPRIRLAQAVSEKSETQERGLKGMFDVLNKTNNAGKDTKQSYEPMLTFYELTGIPEYDSKGSAPGMVSTGLGENFNLFSMLGTGKAVSTAAMVENQVSSSSLMGVIGNKPVLEVPRLPEKVQNQPAIEPQEGNLLMKTRIEETASELQETELPKAVMQEPDADQAVVKSTGPVKNDLYSAFLIGTVTTPKKKEVNPESAVGDALWASLAIGLTKAKRVEKKPKEKKTGFATLFRNK